MDRRTFMSGGAMLGLAPLLDLRPVSAQETKAAPSPSGVAALVKLIEETPRDRLLEEVGSRIKAGAAYKDVLAALQLATVRSVQPRPSVGFKFHTVLVVNSCHLASLTSPEADRWLPILWAIDHFKGPQAEEKQKSGWTQKPVAGPLPSPDKAGKALSDALNGWDEGAADLAAAALVGVEPKRVFELLALYGPRDFRSIGHKAIFAANGWRTLECIGWEHAEPILRSLAHAFTAHEGSNPTKGDAPADRPWRRNPDLAKQIREGWREGKVDSAATTDLLAALRTATDEEAAKKTVELLNAGVSPQSVWDALFAASGELLMRRPNIQSLHAVTTMNAIRYLFATSAADETRRILMLQAASFLPMFRGNDPKLRDLKIDALEAEKAGGVAEIFEAVPKDRMAAARKALGFLQGGGKPEDLVAAGRVLVFLKGQDAHDYKFGSAALEDCAHLSPGWRERFLASSLFYLKGSGSPDSGLLGRMRAALKA